MMQADYENNDLGILYPYEDLYIYYLQGRVSTKDERNLGEYFLGNWVEDNTSFLFFSSPAQEELARLLKRRDDLDLIDDYQFTYKEWQGSGLDTLSIEQFLICPPWLEIMPDEGVIRISLDPGVVFGNGLHPTTRDCLRALAYTAREKPFYHVLDLGTGTGILALAAAFLGGKRVMAVDLNPLCVKTAIRNVGLNNLDHIVQVAAGRAEDCMKEPADLVLANIHHEVVARFIENRDFQDGRRFIISGLMRSSARDIKDRMEKKGLRLIREWDHEMTWYTMLFQSG
ncbi:MAG: 50S ribosomal protein L11 methyltransferase [Deltaproteobacteria bacterium]|nr:50S ribosomal protein L11 methyltransferase [Deltaproteobacteria bacterium]